MSEAATALIARQLQQLGDLAEIGLEIARAVEARVKAAGPQDDLDPFVAAYARVARAVRLSIMLQSRLIDQRDVAQRREAYDHKQALDFGKARIEREVERAVLAAHGDDKPEVDRLMTETADRLDLEDYGDILQRPVEEVVALICKDLGLAADGWVVEGVEEVLDGQPSEPPEARTAAASPARGEAGPRSGGEGIPPPGPGLAPWFDG
jgi:hypothetical protein